MNWLRQWFEYPADPMLLAGSYDPGLVLLSFLIAVFLFPALVPETPPDLFENLLAIFLLFLKEAFYGLLFGFAMGAIFYGFEAAGSMIDNQRGVSIARLLIPQLNQQGSLSGNFLFQMSIVLFLVLNGHLLFLEAFLQSFVSLPVLQFPDAGANFFSMLGLFVDITSEVLYVSVQLAAPVMIAIFMADIILGIANRVAPQINVWELGFNIKGYVGVLLLFVSITMIGQQFEAYAIHSVSYVPRITEYLKEKPPSAPSDEEPVEEGLPAEDALPQVLSPQPQH